MKIVRRGALPVGGESGLLDVRDRALEIVASSDYPAAQRGTVREEDVWPGFVDKVLSFVDVERDPAAARRDRRGERDGRRDAAAGARAAADRRGHAATSSPTGRSRTTSRTRSCPRTASSSCGRRREEGADLGVAYDGDADRCFFVDDTGEFVPGDFITALLAESILEKEPGGKVIYDVRASWAVPETIERAGGVPLVNRVGHAYIKHRMREEGAVFGGEVSAHYYFRDFSQADSGVVPFLLMLELISKRGRKLSEILAPYRERYFLTGEINTPVADVALKLQELKERFGRRAGSRTSTASRSTYDDWHFNVRPSNTEPLLRLNLEARSQELMEAKRDEVLELIRSSSSGASPTAGRRSSTPRSRASGSRTPTRRGSSTTAATCPTSTTRARSTTATSASAGRGSRAASSSCAPRRRVPRAGALRRPARDLRPARAHRPDERDLRVRGVPPRRGHADGDGEPDARAHRPRASGGRAEIPADYRERMRAFEGEDLEA